MAKVGKPKSTRYPARTKNEARNRYKHFLQKSLDCVASTVWYTAGAPRGGKGDFVLLTAVSPIPLQTNRGQLFFTATQNFHYERDRRFTGEWKVKTDRYEYQLSESAVLKSELIAWHWHPGSSVKVPHLHAPIASGGEHLSRLHVPTGRISFEEVCRFLLVDLEAKPNRDDWRDVLMESDARFKQWQSWR